MATPFRIGFYWGAGVACIILVCGMLVHGNGPFLLTQLHAMAAWLGRNLGWSLLPFLLTLILYWRVLHRLYRCLIEVQSLAGRDADKRLSRIAQLEHVCDTWVGVFFGIGVIWTAIGMRSALMFALADVDPNVAEDPAKMLARLVDGGILVALSSTIFGGVGGYMMRVAKSLKVGPLLRQYYVETQHAQQAQVLNKLTLIETALRARYAVMPGVNRIVPPLSAESAMTERIK